MKKNVQYAFSEWSNINHGQQLDSKIKKNNNYVSTIFLFDFDLNFRTMH